MNNSWYSDLKVGDLIKCTTTKLKHCDLNSNYTVAELKKKAWGGLTSSVCVLVRIEGSNHFVEIRGNFGPVELKDIRAEKIRVLNGEPKKSKGVHIGRKIDRNKNIEEKKFKLFELLLGRWFTDRGWIAPDWDKHKDAYYSYEEFLEKIVKSDKIFGVELEDFEAIKDMKVSEAFDLYIKMMTGKIK